jgi:hypothetical protein
VTAELSQNGEIKAVGARASNRNAVGERWVQGVKRECLGRSALFDGAHLRYLLQEYLVRYYACRPHPAPGNRPPCGADPPAAGTVLSPDDVVCDERLGGLLKHYHRKAA